LFVRFELGFWWRAGLLRCGASISFRCACQGLGVSVCRRGSFCRGACLSLGFSWVAVGPQWVDRAASKVTGLPSSTRCLVLWACGVWRWAARGEAFRSRYVLWWGMGHSVQFDRANWGWVPSWLHGGAGLVRARTVRGGVGGRVGVVVGGPLFRGVCKGGWAVDGLGARVSGLCGEGCGPGMRLGVGELSL